MDDKQQRGSAPGGRGGRGGERGERGGRGDKRGGGRDGKGRGKGGRDDKRDGGAGSASYRVVSEMGELEKALGKADYAAQKKPLEEVLRALRPLQLRSVEQLDLNTRGRMLTTLLRVGRQPRPADAGPAEAPAAADVPAPDAPAAVEAAPDAVAPAEGEATAAEAGAPDAAAPVEGAPSSEPVAVAAPAEPAKPAEDPKLSAWRDVMSLLGAIWRAVGDADKADRAFEASGRPPPAEGASRAAPAAGGTARPERAGRPERGPRATTASGKPELMPGDWRLRARDIEESGRTREAGRMHELHGSFAEAARLFEITNDVKSSLRNALKGGDEARSSRLLATLKPEEVPVALEQAGAWEKLMAFQIKAGNFEAVAKLYERAKQFDQAGLAWERAGKLALARKAYERVKDGPAMNRVRDLEVKKLIERGDRLGAATILLAAGQKDAALEALKGLAGQKAFRFMQKLKLDEEALAFARAEVAKAVEEKAHQAHARWLELLGDTAAAVEAWLLAERKDKALPLLEQLGNWQGAAELAEAVGQLDKAQELFHRANDHHNAERVAKLPRPAVVPTPPPDPADDEAPPPAARA